MLIFVFYVIVAFIMSYFVTGQGSVATLYIGQSVLYNIPLLWVVFASIVLGLFLASLNTIKNIVQSKVTIFGQKMDLKKSYKTSEDLQFKVDKLEEEKLALKEEIKELKHPKKSEENEK